mgnify:CR=1 FL=1
MTAINTKYPDRDLRSNGALRIFYGILLINMICTINKIFSFPLKVLVNFYGYLKVTFLVLFLIQQVRTKMEIQLVLQTIQVRSGFMILQQLQRITVAQGSKKITNKNARCSWKCKCQVGDTVSYRIEAKSPAYSTATDGSKIGFEIRDKLTNLEFVSDSIKAYIVSESGDAEIDNQTILL